jgi:arylsulfatase A-like enzyme
MSELKSRPNIVFFMVDQLSAKWLEGMSHRACPTPNIDKVRETGVTFTQFISGNPICCACRATIATGLSTRGHAVLQNGYELDESLPTFMSALKDAGWRTGAFGKIHLHSHYHSLYPNYRPYGWETVHNTEDPRGGEWLDWVEEEHPEHYESALATVWATGVTGFKQYGPDKKDLTHRIREIRRNFQWGTPEHAHANHAMYTLPFPEPLSQTAWITRHALEFIENTDNNKPLYAHISYVQPHLPSCPPADFMDVINSELIPEPILPEWAEDRYCPRCFHSTEGASKTIPVNWREKRWYYLADVAHLDHQLRLVLEALERAGRLENTYLLFLSDHGEMLLDHGFSGKAERHYDACIRVPLTICGPGLDQGLTVDSIVQHEDIFPTVLDIAGLPLPQPSYIEQVQGMEDLEGSAGIYERGEIVRSLTTARGRSLVGLCRRDGGKHSPGRGGDNQISHRDAAYTESYNNIDSFTPDHWARTVRTREWRYTLYPHAGGEQLFHLKDDPDETRNLVCDAGHKAVRREMRDRLLEEIILQDYPHTPRGLFALGAH